MAQSRMAHEPLSERNVEAEDCDERQRIRKHVRNASLRAMTERDVFEIKMELPSRNALDADAIAWISARFTEAGDRPVLIEGTDEAFCAGLNLKYAASLDLAQTEAFLRSVDALVVQIFEHPAPVVAHVSGHAIAGGCVMALACDHIVATDNDRVRIGVNEVALGACFPPAIFNMLRLRLSPRHVQRVLLGAQLFAPRTADELGLIDECSAEAGHVARARLAALASHPAETYRITKMGLRVGKIYATPEQERQFVEEEVPQWTSDEVRARIHAALNR